MIGDIVELTDEEIIEINDYVDRICLKFGYSEELSIFLHSVILGIIKYYGIEYKEQIFNTFENVELHVQAEDEDTNAFLNDYFGEDVSDTDYVLSPLAFFMPVLKRENDSFNLRGIIYITNDSLHNFDLSDESCQSTIVHEMCHAIKTYRDPKVEGDRVFCYSGLLKLEWHYDSSSNSIEEVGSYNVALEEGINTLDELSIMSIIKGYDISKESGYALLLPYVRNLLSYKDINEVIRKSQFDGTEEWIDYLGKSSSKLLVDNLSNVLIKIGVKSDRRSFRQKLKDAEIARKNLDDFFSRLEEKDSELDDMFSFEEEKDIYEEQIKTI